MVEPPELQHISYMVELPKEELATEMPVASDEKLAATSESKSSIKKTSMKAEQEVKQEVKQADTSKHDTLKEKKDVDRPPIFVTLQ